jgi:signal transduction histidine kinase
MEETRDSAGVFGPEKVHCQSEEGEGITTRVMKVAHDLNNFLGTIIGYSDMLNDQARTGRKIEADLLDEVLEAALQAKNATRHLVEISSRPGTGARTVAHSQPLITEQPLVSESGLALSGAQVLIVDDDQQFAAMLAKLVQRSGHEPTVAWSLGQARELAAVMTFEAVLLDVHLPDGNGLELIPEVRSWQGEPEVIILTGQGEATGAELAINSGAWYYIEKGSSNQALILPLTRVLQYQREKRQVLRKERLSVMGQLAGGVAHELRNPLGVISNAIYYLRMVLAGGDPNVSEYLEMIARELVTSEKIISDLLHFSRIPQAEKSPVTLAVLLGEVLEKNPPPDNVEVRHLLTEALPAVYVDRRQISQVLVNLVTNAYEALSAGGELRLEAGADDSNVYLSVTDTGVGIPDNHLDRIFEPLFTTKAGGFGLGLAVTQNLVKANQGVITATSDGVSGTTFTLSLPVAEPEP